MKMFTLSFGEELLDVHANVKQNTAVPAESRRQHKYFIFHIELLLELVTRMLHNRKEGCCVDEIICGRSRLTSMN